MTKELLSKSNDIGAFLCILWYFAYRYVSFILKYEWRKYSTYYVIYFGILNECKLTKIVVNLWNIWHMLYIGVGNEMSGSYRYIYNCHTRCRIWFCLFFKTLHPNLAYYISLQINSFLIETSPGLFLFHYVPDLVCCLSAEHVYVFVRYWVAVALPISWQTIELPHQQKRWSQLDGKCGTCDTGAISHRSLWSLPLSLSCCSLHPTSLFHSLSHYFFLSLSLPACQLAVIIK